MTKNMTRKGLALGAASALLISGFSALPASSAGLADTSFVSLAPTTGTEYGMNAANGVTFSMTSNEAATISTGNTKFLVTDASGVIEPKIVAATEATMYRSVAVANNAVVAITVNAGSTDVVKITDATLAAGLTSGDSIYFAADLNADDGSTNDLVIASDDTSFEVTVAGNDVSFVTDVGLSATTQNRVDATGLVVRVIREARHATNNTYVVDTGVSSAAANELLVLAADGAGVSRSVTVQAWMDANGNDLLDSTEYASPLRTVTWTKPSEIVTATTMSPIVGDNKLSAVITTTPVLNGNQVLVQDNAFVNAKFTRSLSSSAGAFADNTFTSNGQGTTTSVWNDTAKTFTVAINTDADAAAAGSDAAGSNVADPWVGLAAPIAADSSALGISTTGLVSVTTGGNHTLVSGDKITMVINGADSAMALAAESTAVTINVTGASTFTYQVSETTGFPASALSDTSLNAGTEFTLATYAGPQGLVDRVGAETYTAQAAIAAVQQGNVVTTGVVAAVSATTTASTAASATVEGASFAALGANVVKIAAGTLSVPVTITVTNAAKTSVGAGRAVALGITSIAGSDTYKVNGKSADTVYTDANGQVTATITTSAGTNAAAVTLLATAENGPQVELDLTWATVAYGLVDLNTTAGTLAAGNIDYDIIKLSSYDLNLMVADQWFNAPAAGTYRFQVTGEGVTDRFVSLVDGRATITATDTGVFGASMDSTIGLQKLTGATWGASSDYVFRANLSTKYKVNVGAAGTTLYGNAVVASVAVAEKSLVEYDKRLGAATIPAYANKLVLNGSVLENATNAAKVGTKVTVTGPSNVLFSDTADRVMNRGSLTFVTGANGKFEIEAYSTTAQTNSVVTFTTSDGATGTIKVSFTGTGVGEGTSLVITAPAAVKPATTFQVSAKLQDAYGNPVDTATGRVKVTYTGSGIIFGTLPTETDSTGSLSFAVLLGSNDTVSAVVTVSYDQNGDGDYVDAKDLTTTSTTVINATGVVASAGLQAGEVVNVGTFNGKIVVYAKGMKGETITWKIAGKWVKVNVTKDYQLFDRLTAAIGLNVNVDVHRAGNSTPLLSKTVLTR